MSESRFGRVITFYSYKGGVGRTLALADVGVMLAKMGHRVLMVDWDLDAPGLSAYFRQWLPTEGGPSLLGLIEDFQHVEPESAARQWSTVSLPDLGDRLALLPAVESGAKHHAQRVQALNWDAKYEAGFGNWLEGLRGRWQRDWDFILVDSRTGFNDIGGVCTMQLPEVLVVFFTPNEQSIDGSVRAARYAQEGQKKMPIDRTPLRVVPVATRLDNTEHEARRKWERSYLERFQPLVDEWTDAPSRTADLLKSLAVPYVPYWSYGEQVPALVGDTSDKLGVERAHENLALLLAQQLADVGRLLDERARAVNQSYHVRPYDIYLSFAKADADMGQRLATELRKLGFRVAESRARERTPDDLLSEILDTVILLGTAPDDAQLQDVETLHDLQRQHPTTRRILPIMLPDVKAEDLPLELAALQWMHFESYSYFDGVAVAIERVLRG